MSKSNRGNRGRALEELIEKINAIYRQKNIALIHKVPTAWIPIRNRQGKIVTAKVDRKASVDFLGVYDKCAVAFDAKYTGQRRMRWDRLAPHQMEFLAAWERAGGVGFVVVGFGLENLYVVPWRWWQEGYDKWQAREDMASFCADDMATGWSVRPGRVPLDYLASVGK